MYRLYAAIILLVLGTGNIQAQRNLGFGVKTGLSFSKFDGPLEGANGVDFEENKMESGFHVGLIVRYKFNRKMGLQSGLSYNQKGTKYKYDGDSYFIFPSGADNIYGIGNREEKLEITNSYIQIPIEYYYRISRLLEVSAGLYGSILVGSTSQGTLIFDGASEQTGNDIQRFRTTLGYDYLRDEAGQSKSLDSRSVFIDGTEVFLPRSFGAYYFFEEVEKNYLRTLDFGITGGLSIYLNQSLFFNVTGIYGLSDVTNQESDISRQSLDADHNFILRDDKDRNLSLQFGIGFVF